ncbi:MAG: discoidin domain-containing protein [Acidobacteriia bacterium]|nr:discoidin domain-containing protein [Terriglobia bacterium]
MFFDNAESGRVSRRKFLAKAAGAAAALTINPQRGRAAPACGDVLDSADSSRVATVRVDARRGHATNSFRPHEALGSSIDILTYGSVDKLYTEPVIKKCLSAGWGPITYRQNTELQIAAWHWNHNGTWSDPEHKSGYFTGDSKPTEFLRHSYGCPLPHRGHTRNGGTEHGYSRLTDGDPHTYWKSNPYLTRKFTGEDDAAHPQWVVIDLGAVEQVNSIRLAWANPFARSYEVQYWTGEDPMDKPTLGAWNTFPQGIIRDGQGGNITLYLSKLPVPARFLRVWMTESSYTPDSHGPDDPRNSAGYALHEVYVGNIAGNGEFVDLVRHSPDQDQTATYCSSIDPWHSESDLDVHAGDQTGFDLFFTSGVTRGLPAMVPVSMLYGTPEDAAEEIAYLKERGYPVSYVEMGEEPDGQYCLPEDYAALYLQFATAIHRRVPEAKLGGPVFQGVNEDIKVWPDAQGRTSWMGRFIDYLKSHGRISDLAFVSFEHYPLPPCGVTWSDLYREPELVSHILQVWKDDGVPERIPMFITESNLSWGADQSFVDMFGALWLAEYAGAFLTAGGNALYHFHFFPRPLSGGCHGAGTFAMFTADKDYQIKQETSQYFAAQLINLEWVKPGNEVHRTFAATCDLRDAAGHPLVAAYVVERPDGEWSLMLVNRDQVNPHAVNVAFEGAVGGDGYFSGPVTKVTFGSEQYKWHAAGPDSYPDPDGPPARSKAAGGPKSSFTLPPASLTVLRGNVSGLGA